MTNPAPTQQDEEMVRRWEVYPRYIRTEAKERREQVLQLRLQGLTAKEIGKQLNPPVGFRAVQRLIGRMRKEGRL